MSGAATGASGAGAFSPFERMVAWRYLRARRAEKFISVIAGISFVGIMLGVATLIIVMAVMNGFRQELFSRILGVSGHVVVEAADQPLGDYADLAALFSTIPGVHVAIPFVEGEALASGRTGAGNGVLVRGIRESDFRQLEFVAGKLRQGGLEGFDSGEGAIIGQRLADQLGVLTDDSVTLVSPPSSASELGTPPQVKAYKVAAIFEVGVNEFDSAVVFLPMTEAQAFFETGDEASAIEIFADDPYGIDPIRTSVQETAGRPLKISDWRERNKTFFDALAVERNVMFMVLALIVLVAALNIVSGLVMMVKEKGADIGILRTIGATRQAVLRVFVMAGSAIGVAGTVAGIALGVLVCWNIGAVRAAFAWFGSGESATGEMAFLSQVPAVIDPAELVTIVVMALALTLLAALLPAWRAARLDPVEALRGAR